MLSRQAACDPDETNSRHPVLQPYRSAGCPGIKFSDLEGIAEFFWE
jgi:hypothetical protein